MNNESQNHNAPLFAQAQNESDMGVLLHFFYLLFRQIRNWFFLYILIFFFIQKWIHNFFFAVAFWILFLIIFFSCIAIFAYLKYKKLLFHIDYEQLEFHIEKGVFQKQTTIFKLERIQQIHIKRNWIQRVLGLASLEIDTAGTKGKEVSLQALSAATAEELRKTLMHLKYKDDNTIPFSHLEEPVSEVYSTSHSSFFKISLVNLLKFSVTDNPLKGLLILIIPINYFYQNLSSFFPRQSKLVEDWAETKDYIQWLFFLAFVLLLSLIFNVIKNVFKYYNIQFEEINEELKISQGLANIKSVSIRPERVQLIEIQQNLLQMALKIQQYKIFQFNQLDRKDSYTLIPGLHKEQIDDLQKILTIPNLKNSSSIIHPKKTMVIVHTAFVQSLFVFISFLYAWMNEILWPIFIYLLMAPFLFYWVFRAYKNYKLELFENYIVKRSGFWNQKTKILNIHKIQNISITQYFWQKKYETAKIRFATTAGSFYFRFGSKNELEKIRNYYLFLGESNPQPWM